MGGARLFLLGGKGGGGKGQGMWGQILAMEGLLMDAWTITGGQLGGGGKTRARGAAAPLPPARTAHGSEEVLVLLLKSWSRQQWRL